MSQVLFRLQAGFAAISALFLLVVLAALGAFMVSFANTQNLTSAQDIQGSRAYWSARAGLEWAIVSTASGSCPASPTALVIDGFSVTVSCTRTTYVDSDTINIFALTSQSVLAGGGVGSPTYIERSVSALLCRNAATPFGFC